MENDAVIQVENVSKKYCRSLKRSMLYGLADIGRNTLGMRSRSHRLRQGEFWAVDGLSFRLKRGETLGIIGPNGSGKTTLLKLLNGIFWPDIGRISIRGRVGALIEVGAGFHPLLTGRENIYVNGAILGMSKREVESKFDDIVAFADIGDFLDTPVKNYSSGMFVRLGFAVAIHCEPDILLVDEILAVGDINFQKKSFHKIYQLRQAGTSIILVSHSMGTILNNTQSCLLLDKGKLVRSGQPTEVVNFYTAEGAPDDPGAPAGEARSSNIIEFNDSPCFLRISEAHRLVRIKVPAAVDADFYIGISVQTEWGEQVTGFNTLWEEKIFKKESAAVPLEFNTDCLVSGRYRLIVDLRDKKFGVMARKDDILLQVFSSQRSLGLVNYKQLVRFVGT